MKTFIAILLACIAGTALCVPAMQFIKYERSYLTPQEQQAAGGPAHTSVEIMIPFVGAAQQPMLPSQGFIKQEIHQGPGRPSIELLYPFGYRQAAPVAPAAAAPAPAGEDEENDD